MSRMPDKYNPPQSSALKKLEEELLLMYRGSDLKIHIQEGHYTMKEVLDMLTKEVTDE